ncbi:MAG: response regulator [Chloroflexi bacterium]|nr:MAG: response regulator [Chloroflexota bacterium]
MKANRAAILLAEDDPDDQYLISEAMDESHLNAQLYVVSNGEELLDYLNRQGKYQDIQKYPMPNLILLDLNMPRKDGREALREIKADPKLQHIPILALTTSKAEKDIAQTYKDGVSGFITKPVSFSGLREVMKTIGSYWLETTRLPPE